MTPQWWRKRCYGRVKGRTETPAPVRCESGDAVRRTDPKLRKRGCGERRTESQRKGVWPRNERSACEWFAESYREPWTCFWGARKTLQPSRAS
jgi:hypothetical protein